jgi:divalent metal cation (Fe/Co/Zn/Cd) transporter
VRRLRSHQRNGRPRRLLATIAAREKIALLNDDSGATLLRRGLRLEYVTLGWNVVGIGVLAWAAISARSVALAGFGLDSLIEIGASTVVVWELKDTEHRRRGQALRLIGVAFALLAVYLAVQGSVVLASGHRAHHSIVGIVWTSLTAVTMYALAFGKSSTGRSLANPVLSTEGRVTLVDGILATSVLAGLVLNAVVGWWWADPAAGFVLLYYAARECWAIYGGRGERHVEPMET